MMSMEQQIESCLGSGIQQVRVIVLEDVGSTNDYAKDCLRGLDDYSVLVVAERQTTGKGRYDREWISPVGGLYATLALRPDVRPSEMGLLTLLAGCAVADGIELETGIQAGLKWPNDVFFDEKKLGGILCESVFHGDVLTGVVIGFGINQNIGQDAFPEGLRGSVITINDILARETPLPSLVCRIVNGIYRRLEEIYAADSFSGIIEEWRGRSVTLGQQVSVHLNGEIVEGKATDIDEDGALTIQTSDGLVTVSTGEVVHLF